MKRANRNVKPGAYYYTTATLEKVYEVRLIVAGDGIATYFRLRDKTPRSSLDAFGWELRSHPPIEAVPCCGWTT